MLVKRLLRFYRSAEKLNGYLDALIEHVAVQSGLDTFSRAEKYVERLVALTADKEKLGNLWARLNSVMEGLTDADRVTLYKYADSRVKPANEADRRETHRAVVKFTRRAFGILSGGQEAIKLVNRYYSLMFPSIGGTT